MKKLFVVLLFAFALLAFTGNSAYAKVTFPKKASIRTIIKTGDVSTGVIISGSNNILDSGIVIKDKSEKQLKIDQLKNDIKDVIPLAEKVKYDTKKLKIYQQQLDDYMTGNIQQMTSNIRKEIQKLKSYVSSKKSK